MEWLLLLLGLSAFRRKAVTSDPSRPAGAVAQAVASTGGNLPAPTTAKSAAEAAALVAHTATPTPVAVAADGSLVSVDKQATITADLLKLKDALVKDLTTMIAELGYATGGVGFPTNSSGWNFTTYITTTGKSDVFNAWLKAHSPELYNSFWGNVLWDKTMKDLITQAKGTDYNFSASAMVATAKNAAMIFQAVAQERARFDAIHAAAADLDTYIETQMPHLVEKLHLEWGARANALNEGWWLIDTPNPYGDTSTEAYAWMFCEDFMRSQMNRVQTAIHSFAFGVEPTSELGKMIKLEEDLVTWSKLTDSRAMDATYEEKSAEARELVTAFNGFLTKASEHVVANTVGASAVLAAQASGGGYAGVAYTTDPASVVEPAYVNEQTNMFMSAQVFHPGTLLWSDGRLFAMAGWTSAAQVEAIRNSAVAVVKRYFGLN